MLFGQRLPSFVGLFVGIATASVSGVCIAFSAPAAQAAETVVLRYGIFRGSIPMADIKEFAETGETSSRLNRYLKRANQEPEQFRQFLTRSVTTEPQRLDQVLESPAGDVLLDELAEYIYSPERRDDEATLKSALTLAATNDSQLSFVELLDKYPTEEVHINVLRVIATYNRFAAIQERVGGVLEGDLGEILREVNPF
jgi:hypothetical protein